jgi:hypothetical protein
MPNGSKPAVSPSTSGSPRPEPSNLLPTGLLPSQLPTQLPSELHPSRLPTLPPLLDKHNGKASKPGKVLPTLSPLPLLSTLKQLLTDR